MILHICSKEYISSGDSNKAISRGRFLLFFYQVTLEKGSGGLRKASTKKKEKGYDEKKEAWTNSLTLYLKEVVGFRKERRRQDIS